MYPVKMGLTENLVIVSACKRPQTRSAAVRGLVLKKEYTSLIRTKSSHARDVRAVGGYICPHRNAIEFELDASRALGSETNVFRNCGDCY